MPWPSSDPIKRQTLLKSGQDLSNDDVEAIGGLRQDMAGLDRR
jgi:hypothetical protein